jgi:hypothetical protein
VYEKTASDRGIQEYARMRGLLITQRETARTWPDGPDRLARTVTASCRLAGRLTHGRLTDAHDEVLCVIRKARGALRASRVTRCPAACPPSRSGHDRGFVSLTARG